MISTAFEAFHVNFNVVAWALIVMGLAIAVSGYVVFEIASGARGLSLFDHHNPAWTNDCGAC